MVDGVIPAPTGWYRALCDADPTLEAVLQAFGGPCAASACSLHAVDAWAVGAEPTLRSGIAQGLQGEVDTDQIHMFARRTHAVAVLLQKLGFRTLWMGLLARTAEVLHGPPPRALRVRAVADFYYSQGARLHHTATTAPRTMAALVATTTWTDVHPGIAHGRLVGAGPAGPVHINVLRADSPRLQCVDLRDDPRNFAEAVSARGAIAGVSGGFFLYSEPDIVPPLQRRQPVGLLVCDGVVQGIPGLRRATLVVDPSPRITRMGPVGWTVGHGADTWTIAACNDPTIPGPTLFTRVHGRRAPRPGLGFAGRHTLSWTDEIPLLGGVVVIPGARRLTEAVPLVWTPPAPIQQAMAGGPMLLGDPPNLDLAREDFCGTAPPITFSTDETYDQNLLPRMAAGIDHQGRLVFAAIDGRDFHRAPGFTLAMTAQLMAALGCGRAMNLDGGSSKRMAIAGALVDLSSTEVQTGTAPTKTPVRKVVSAILVHGR